MSSHFVYQHLPAQNLGFSDPYRPYVSGGLGAAIFVVVVTNVTTGQLEYRWYYGDPESDWAVYLGTAAWETDEPDLTWAFDEMAKLPWEDPELVWSAFVGDTLWSVWSPRLDWGMTLLPKWSMEGHEVWAMNEFTPAWSFGKVTS